MAEHSFVVHELEQRTDEWKQLRCGRLTASVAHEFLAKNKDGKPSASRRNLLMRLVLEQVTGKPQEKDKDFRSAAMQAGVDREEDAGTAYEAETGHFVRRCGFIEHTSLMAGASLDGYLGDFTSLISIKCRQPAAHWDFLRTGAIPFDAMAQMRHELWLTGATHHEYVSWNPDFPDYAQLRTTTLEAAAFNLDEYDFLLRAFLTEIEREVGLLEGWKAIKEAAVIA